MPPLYAPARAAVAATLPVRGLNYHLNLWGDASQATPERPLLLMLHGWMDVGASFQFVVDALAALEGPARFIAAPDWRGFGGTRGPDGADSYWFADYLGDLDAIGDALSPGAPFDLLGHSMGGNIAMSYAGARTSRIRRLINLEGFGLPPTQPEQAGARLAQWLDELKQPQSFAPYRDAAAVAARLMKTNPRLPPDKAAWLARQWAAPAADAPQGPWQLRADAAHRRVNPMLYRVDETLALWRAIVAPLLWAEGAATDLSQWWGQRYSKSEFETRLAVVGDVRRVTLDDCGHMLHHDQPERLAQALHRFLD
jgi:pimeloyl-ACP methyl ester carboxylesterase